MNDKAIRSAKLTAAGILDKARAKTAITRAGGQIAPSKYLPDVPRQVHAGGGKVTDSDSFKNWFAGSKVRDFSSKTSSRDTRTDEEFEPLPVYHGTRHDFDEFRPHGTGTTTFMGIPVQHERHGIFFSESPEFSEAFANPPGERKTGKVMKFHLNLKNPLIADADGYVDQRDKERLKSVGMDHGFVENYLGAPTGNGAMWENFDGPDGKDFVDKIKAAGYDGVKFHEEDPDTGKLHATWVAFHPSQVKSPDMNSGAFNPSDNRFSYADGGRAGKAAGGKVAFMQGNHPDVPDVLYHGNAPKIANKGWTSEIDPEQTQRNIDAQDFRTFRPSDWGNYGKGIYLSDSPNVASDFAQGIRSDQSEVKPHGQVMKLHASIKQPFTDDALRHPAWIDYIKGALTKHHLPHDEDRNARDAFLKQLDDGTATVRDMFVRDTPHGTLVNQWGNDAIHDTIRRSGFDGIIAHRPDGTKEYVAFKPEQVKSATGNQGTFDPNEPDMTKAEGGRIGKAYGGGFGYVPQAALPQLRLAVAQPLPQAQPKGGSWLNTLTDLAVAAKKPEEAAAPVAGFGATMPPSSTPASTSGAAPQTGNMSGFYAPFKSDLDRLIAEAPGAVTVTSGYRTPERQQELWDQHAAKYPDPEVRDNYVARPGSSSHNYGLAADLSFASPEVQQWVHDNAAKYNLQFRMDHEGWHIEPINLWELREQIGPPAGYADGGEVGENDQNEGTEVEKAPTAYSQTGTQALGLLGSGGVRGGQGILPAPAQTSGEEDLTGLPKSVKMPKLGQAITAAHDPRIRQVSRDYAQQSGIRYNPPTTYQKVDPARAKRIADAYEAMPHEPNHPLVKASYEALLNETKGQYEAMKRAGVNLEFYPDPNDDPYKSNPRLAVEDVKHNNHMYIYPTDAGYGSGDALSGADENPLLRDSGERWHGKPVLFNDLFRAVHDYFGHAKEGVGFRADGEENAWRQHAAMFSPLARIALGSETRGQNSWLNYGPHGDKNRTAATEDTVFADQKLGVLPHWVHHEGAEDFIQPHERKQMEDIYRAYGKIDDSPQWSESEFTPDKFSSALKSSPFSSTLTQYDPSEVREMINKKKFSGYKLAGKDAYFGIKHGADYVKDYGFEHPALTGSENTLVGVVNNDKNARGVGDSLMKEAIKRGVTALDAFAVPSDKHPRGFLADFYGKHGFKELGRVPFDPKYVTPEQLSDMKRIWAKSGWDEKRHPFPDVVIMKRATGGSVTGKHRLTQEFSSGGAAKLMKARKVNPVDTALSLTRRFTKDGTGATMALKTKGK